MVTAIKRMLPVSFKNYVKARIRDVRRIVTQDTSQNWEVSYLRRAMTPDTPHFFVDVGAYDGKNLSNSYFFVRRRGWGAILIEPVPASFQQMQKHYVGRSDVMCINKAISNQQGVQTLYLGKHASRSALSASDSAWVQNHRTDQTIMVETDTLTNILSEYRCPADFGVLSVDAEGLDYDILAGLDFKRFRPRYIITEDERDLPEKNAPKYRLLEQSGYSCMTRLGWNTIWKLNHV